MIGTLLTFPGFPLPFVPPAKESGAEVLLAISACRVVVGDAPPLPALPGAEPPPPGPEDVAPECCNERQAGQVKTPEMSAKTQNACETLRQTMEPLAFTRLIGRGVQRPSLTSAAEVLETGFCEDCV